MGHGGKTGGISSEGHLANGALFACGGETLGLLSIAESGGVGLCGARVELYVPAGIRACCGVAAC